jgi:hypothetical protein
MLVVFAGIPTIGGLIPIWWGLSILIGRRVLTIRNGTLRTDERVGPLFYGKSWKLETIGSLNITNIIPIDAKYPHPQWANGLDALIVFSDGQRGMLAWGYPQEVLDPLARNLARDIERGVAIGAGASSAAATTVGVTNDYRPQNDTASSYAATADDEEDLDEDFEDEEDVYQDLAVQPADSKIEYVEFEDGLTIKVPPSGLLRGTSGLFAFSMLWNGVLTAITVCGGIAAGKNGLDEVLEEGGYFALGIFGLFWLVGIAVMLAAINMGRRRAAIAIAGDALMVIQSGPFGTKKREWPLSAVDDVRVGPSGIQVNDVDVLELQVHDRENRKFGMLAGRKNDELYWLEFVLQSKLRTLASAYDQTEVAPDESAAADTAPEVS